MAAPEGGCGAFTTQVRRCDGRVAVSACVNRVGPPYAPLREKGGRNAGGEKRDRDMSLRVVAYMVAALAVPLAAAAERTPEDPAWGLWLTENERAIVEIAPCGGETCGRMVWVANPVDEAGEPKRDANNADGAKRERPICGLELVGGLHRTDDGTWTEGWLYNPRDGATYSAEMRTLSPGQLEVRGYLGVPVLGKSQVWTRVGDDRGGCPS